MSRPGDLWFRQSNGFHHSTIDGRQVKVERDETKARAKLQRILRGKQEGSAPGMAVGKLCDLFLEHSEAENEKNAFEVHQ